MQAPSLKEKKKQSNQIISYIEGVSIKVKKDTSKIQKEIIKETIEINETKKPYTASSLIAKSVDSKMKKVISSTKKDFREFLNQNERYLSKNYSIDLTKADIKAISRKKDLIIDELSDNAGVLSRDLKSILLGNLAKGVPTRDLVLELTELYPAFARNSETIIRTGLGRTFSDINTSKFKQENFDWYTWAGPNDKVTRELPCKHFVGKKFPAEQLGELASIRQTLYNCRHSIIPLTEEEAETLILGDIKEF